MDKTIDMMENYIVKYQKILQDMIEKLVITKKILYSSNIAITHINPVLQTKDIKSE
jgi:predicted TIM-barrel fold metal-dependent hydrolase